MDKIIRKIRSVKRRGYIKSIRPDATKQNDGAVGNTLEEALGIKENNKRLPDYKGWEIKSHKITSQSYITLFSRTPDSEYKDGYMNKRWGKLDDEYPHIKVLRTSIYAHRHSEIYRKHKLKLKIDRRKKKIFLIDINNPDEKVYWKFDSIKQSAVNKIKNMIICTAQSKVMKNKMYFKYINTRLLISFDFNKFIKLLENGVIRYDHRLGIYRSGKKKGEPHNHGGGFRIHPQYVHKIYRKEINF